MTLWYRFRRALDAARGLSIDCDNKTRWFSEASYYDEEYKLGPNPDIAALEQAGRHLEQAYRLMERFDWSLRHSSPLVVRPPKLTKRQHPTMRVRYAEAAADQRRLFPDTEPWQ
jgi:hypothetical protein